MSATNTTNTDDIDRIIIECMYLAYFFVVLGKIILVVSVYTSQIIFLNASNYIQTHSFLSRL